MSLDVEILHLHSMSISRLNNYYTLEQKILKPKLYLYKITNIEPNINTILQVGKKLTGKILSTLYYRQKYNAYIIKSNYFE